MITLSGLSHVAACPGSASLPQQRRESGAAPPGRAGHEVIEAHVRGLDVETWMRIADAHGLDAEDTGRLRFLARNLALGVPRGALTEVPLGYWPDGSVRRIEGGAGSYPDVGQWLSGQLDCMWSEPTPLVQWDGRENVADCDETLWVVDWKTGDDENVPPIARNWQLRGGALLAARWTGAFRVIPAICYVNAAECGAAVREGRAYTGRWEVGDPLDAAALDAIDVEMCAVLARARGDGDGTALDGLPERTSGGSGVASRRTRANTNRVSGGHVDGSDAGHADSHDDGRAFVTGPQCEFCDARGACPAFASEALTLARGAGIYAAPTESSALSHEARSYLAGMLPAMKSLVDKAEAAVRAGGPVALADGRVYAPAVEPVTTYRTRETFDALVPLVGEERANEAAEYTGTSIKRALDAAGAPRGAWGRLRKELEVAGAVVVTGREVWRRRYPATPVEVEDAEAERRESARGSPPGSGRPCSGSVVRGPCSACGRLYTLPYGRVRKHQQPGGGLYCKGSGQPPGGAPPAQPARAERPSYTETIGALSSVVAASNDASATSSDTSPR